jgi:hypothetical protein
MHRNLSLSLAPLILAFVCSQAACGGGDVGGGGPTSPGTLAIAGTYQIVQRAVSTTCGDTGSPPTVTGTVTHTPGTTPFVLSDTGGTTFNGNVQPDGAFVANAVLESGGQTFTQRLEGTFSPTGFTARLNVTVSPRNCAFTRDWTGTRQ